MSKPDTTVAERMRRYRARKKAAGLAEVRRWTSATSLRPFSDHRIHEIRSLAMHALIARKLMRDRKVLERARQNLARWRARQEQPATYLAEWEAILSRPVSEIAGFLVSPDEDPTRLRQSSPFAGALSPRERKRFFDAFRA